MLTHLFCNSVFLMFNTYLTVVNKFLFPFLFLMNMILWIHLHIYSVVSIRINHLCILMIVCLFVCLRFYFPLENFSVIWRCHHYRWRNTNFDLYLALMAIKQWGFFKVPHLLWHRVHSHQLRSIWQWSCHYLV